MSRTKAAAHSEDVPFGGSQANSAVPTIWKRRLRSDSMRISHKLFMVCFYKCKKKKKKAYDNELNENTEQFLLFNLSAIRLLIRSHEATVKKNKNIVVFLQLKQLSLLPIIQIFAF